MKKMMKLSLALLLIGAGLLSTAPALAQVVKATVKINGMI